MIVSCFSFGKAYKLSLMLRSWYEERQLQNSKYQKLRYNKTQTFFFSSTSCFDFEGFFKPAFIIPTEKDFSLLCEIVCRDKLYFRHIPLGRDHISQTLNLNASNMKNFEDGCQRRNYEYQFRLTFIDPGANASGDKPHGRVLSEVSDCFAAITWWIGAGRMLPERLYG